MAQLEYVGYQNAALQRAPRSSTAISYASALFGRAVKRARMFVFAADIVGDAERLGKKRYTAATVDDFLAWYSVCEPHERMHYELLDPDSPSIVYFDLDGSLHCDENREKCATVQRSFKRDFTNFLEHVAAQSEGDCKVLRATEYGSDEKRALPSERAAQFADDMIMLDSSTDRKFSLHVGFPDIVMKNMFHCGAVMRRFEKWIVRKYGNVGRDNPYYIQVEDDPDMREFVVDRAVYTKHRLMRLFMSSKTGQKRPLYLRREDGTLLREFDREVFERALIQNTFARECDRDESAYATLPDGTRSRLVLRGGPTNLHLFSVCEVRTPMDLENAEKYPATAEWLEPSSIGKRIIGFTYAEIESLDLKAYIPTRLNAESSAPFSAATTSSSSFTYTRCDAAPSNSDLLNFRRLLLRKHARQTTFGDGEASARITQLRQSIVETSKEVVRDIVGTSAWWNTHEDVAFCTRYTCDASRRSVMLSTRNRYCEVKGDEHTSNHVYFVVYPYAGRGRRGGVKQYCHSACPNEGRALHPPVTGAQHSKFRFLRARMDRLYALTYGATISVPFPCRRRYDVGVRHVVSVLARTMITFRRFVDEVVDADYYWKSSVDTMMRSFHESIVDMCLSPFEKSDDDDDDNDDDTEDDDDEGIGGTAHVSSIENSLDYRDCSNMVDDDVAEVEKRYLYFGVVDALCTHIAFHAFARLAEERRARMARLFIVFRSTLLFYIWKSYGLPTTHWLGDKDLMCYDVDAWTSSTGSPYSRCGDAVRRASSDTDALHDTQMLLERSLHARFTAVCEYAAQSDGTDVYSDFVDSCSRHLLPHLNFGQ